MTKAAKHTPTERDDAVRLANTILDKPFIDPDGDICMLARQFLRATEALGSQERLIETLTAALEPFAEVASEWDGEPASLHVFFEWNDESAPVPSLPVDCFRTARTALAQARKG